MLIRRIKTFSEEQKKSNLVAPGIAATGTALSVGGSGAVVSAKKLKKDDKKKK